MDNRERIMRELKIMLHPYYFVNTVMSISFIASKLIPQLCWLVFDGNCEFESRQSEILFFLLMVIMIRSRKTGSMSISAYFSNAFVYCKVANAVLWFFHFKIYGIIYLALFFAQAMLLPQPTYKGPQQIVYFRDQATFKEEISKDKKTAWLIEFYTAWNPSCVNFAPVFGELSAKYGLDNLKFGKVDLARFPDIGAEYGIFDSYFVKQLPTLILFKDGRPDLIKPSLDANKRIIKFHMNLDNIIQTFGLNELYKECKTVHAQKQKTKKGGHEKAE